MARPDHFNRTAKCSEVAAAAARRPNWYTATTLHGNVRAGEIAPLGRSMEPIDGLLKAEGLFSGAQCGCAGVFSLKSGKRVDSTARKNLKCLILSESAANRCWPLMTSASNRFW